MLVLLPEIGDYSLICCRHWGHGTDHLLYLEILKTSLKITLAGGHSVLGAVHSLRDLVVGGKTFNPSQERGMTVK